MDCSTPGFPVPYHLLEFAQTHVHWVNDTIQSSHPLLPSSPPALSLSQHRGLFQFRLLASGGQSIGPSVSATVLPVNIQGWFHLGLTGLISLLSKSLKSLLKHCNWKASILWCSAFFMIQLSHPYMTSGKPIVLTIQTFVGKMISLLFNTLSRFVIAFLPRSNSLLISRLKSLSTVIWSPRKKVYNCFHFLSIYLPWSNGTRCHDLCFLNVEF